LAIWAGVIVAGVAMAGLGVYFVVIGLDWADKLAGVIGVFVGLAGLSLAGYGALLTGHPTRLSGWPSSLTEAVEYISQGAVRRPQLCGEHLRNSLRRAVVQEPLVEDPPTDPRSEQGRRLA
jgi:hypothetical protein